MRAFFTSIILLFITLHGFSQELHFSEVPEDYQLYARNELDSAEVKVSGKIIVGTNIEKLKLKIFKSNEHYDTKEIIVHNNEFSLATTIHSGLHEFKFELYVTKKGIDSLYYAADNIVCGDVYVITGQSNSHASSSLSTYSNPFCRSFGVKTGFEPYNDDDKKVRWGLATGNAPDLKGVGGWFKKNKFGVGVWGMELMKLIVEKYQVPVCIVNGGSGSSSIEQNMLYPEKPSLETSFGRLAYRLDQAGLKDKVKAIFWHQGETNTNKDKNPELYATNFDTLLFDWKRLYTGLEKIYLFQLHPGCGGDYQSELRETQRQIAEKYDMIEIMSTTGVTGNDNCHFSYEGYIEFAKRIFPLVSRDFYGEKTKLIITPPKLEHAYYIDKNHIVLTFDQSIYFEEKYKVNGTTHYLKDQFFFSNGNNNEKVSALVENITNSEKEIVLQIKDAKPFTEITYLPNRTYLNTDDVYKGPWIRGKANDLGALSFDRNKIKKTIQTNDNEWHGYKLLDSTLNGVNFKVVFPKKANKNRDWIWRARFWDVEPQTDLALLEKGFHVAYIDVSGLFGNNKAIKIWDGFYEFITTKYQLNGKVVLEGMSRGGLIIFNWSNRNAKKIACIYGDAPVCDFKSWPAGKGLGEGHPKTWETCLNAYGFTEETALLFKGNPIDHMDYIASNKVPILIVVGDVDTVVPVSENTEVLKKRLKTLGWDLNIIHKPGVGHHPHSLENPKPIVDFILKHTSNTIKI
ncbi:sialate O-acetylesterase [Formosa sp. PL04]|uniref:sialate O-acetylesterase n=1 Tax=Formosa sp. PL04 TaxID=3081755 RepID=UPI002980C57F|nr:sialate O-acetylesterase [Formosa sp. PL04]MDW5290126.1 sialate O-acetylesterase [Formosa sp. PL04]